MHIKIYLIEGERDEMRPHFSAMLTNVGTSAPFAVIMHAGSEPNYVNNVCIYITCNNGIMVTPGVTEGGETERNNNITTSNTCL